MVMQCQDVRRMGSAAPDLCYIAAGRNDVHWELELKPWDSAAGAAIVHAAGGRVSDLAGAPYSPWHNRVVASNGLIHNSMIAVLVQGSRQRL